jgi:hypothetical protein
LIPLLICTDDKKKKKRNVRRTLSFNTQVDIIPPDEPKGNGIASISHTHA